MDPETVAEADLLLTGPLLDVHQALKRQALDAGMELGAGCSTAPGATTTCRFNAQRVEGGRVVGEVNVLIEQTSTLEGGYSNHASIRHAGWRPGAGPDAGGLGGLVPLEDVPAAAAPPDVPGVGEPIAEDQVAYENPDVIVAEGSEVLGPVKTYTECTGGFVAHLVVTGEPDVVVADYERQLDEWTNFQDGDGPTTQVFRGHETLHDSRYASGGGDLTMDVVYGDEEPTYLRLSRCND